jgi:hypothetical protein
MEDETAGDPITGLKWTRKTTEKISNELKRLGIAVCANTVGRLLKKLDFSLKTNRKKYEGNANLDPKDRDKQFRYIAEQRRLFIANGYPVVSVDAKKKELVGNFKNAGATYRRKSENVNVYDFPSDAKGKVTPYGIYDLVANTGAVFVGTSFDTPSFAVESIARWWKIAGVGKYSSKKLKALILADGGGSNSSRSRVWKYEMQKKVCCEYDLEITVCHYPPGCSKYNPIEHRLFSAISANWKGVPLRSYETVVNYIKTTMNSKGLKVDAFLVTKDYEKGKKISDKQMSSLAEKLKRHKIFPNWNYTLSA